MNKKLNRINLCYNCSADLTKVDRDEEHIPAKNLFVDSKNNGEIIKVPSCRACNVKFSETDDYLRDAIGWQNDSLTELTTLTGKTVRKLFVHGKDGFKRMDKDGNTHWMNFNVAKLYVSHIKNFKGIFMWENLFPISDEYHIETFDSYSDRDEFEAKSSTIAPLLTLAPWEVSGSKEIFYYRFTGIDFDDSKEEYVNTIPIWICEMVYHNRMSAFVYDSNVARQLSPE